MVAAGATTHPCDVRLGRDTVAVLAANPDASDASEANYYHRPSSLTNPHAALLKPDA